MTKHSPAIELKDYLHLYLGCEFIYGNGPNIWDKWSGITKGRAWYYKNEDFIIMGSHTFRLKEIKLVLRKLDSMTGKEVLTAFHMSYDDAKYEFSEYEEVNNNNFGWRARNQKGMECFLPKNSFKPEVMRWLLSKHFDLFQLIEKGLAIDKNKTHEP